MSPEQWVYAGLGLLVTVHLALFVYTYRSRLPVGSDRGDAAPPSPESGGTDFASDTQTVTCRNCGAENEHDYRFCRRCVGELPGHATGRGGGDAPGSRELL